MMYDAWHLKYDIWNMRFEIWNMRYDVVRCMKYDVGYHDIMIYAQIIERSAIQCSMILLPSLPTFHQAYLSSKNTSNQKDWFLRRLQILWQAVCINPQHSYLRCTMVYVAHCQLSTPKVCGLFFANNMVDGAIPLCIFLWVPLFDTWQYVIPGSTDLFLAFPFQNSKPRLAQNFANHDKLIKFVWEKMPDEDTWVSCRLWRSCILLCLCPCRN